MAGEDRRDPIVGEPDLSVDTEVHQAEGSGGEEIARADSVPGLAETTQEIKDAVAPAEEEEERDQPITREQVLDALRRKDSDRDVGVLSALRRQVSGNNPALKTAAEVLLRDPEIANAYKLKLSDVMKINDDYEFGYLVFLPIHVDLSEQNADLEALVVNVLSREFVDYDALYKMLEKAKEHLNLTLNPDSKELQKALRVAYGNLFENRPVIMKDIDQELGGRHTGVNLLKNGITAPRFLNFVTRYGLKFEFDTYRR